MSIRHVGITVRDMDESLAFYARLGFRKTFEVKRDEPFIGEIVGCPKAVLGVAMVRRGNVTLELLCYTYPRFSSYASRFDGGHMHLCLDWDADLDAALDAAGSRIGRAVIPDGQQKGAEATYWAGPSGEIIEVFRPANNALAVD